MQEFYIHKKGWYILRPKDAKIGQKMANAMKQACNNPNIGYDQNQRLGIIKYGTLTKTKTECDCSSLVRQCIIEASGKDVGDFTTANEAHTLISSGLFDRLSFDKVYRLKTGDVLVTKSKGHTVIVVEACLKKGDKGGYVKELQTLLNYSSCLKEPLVKDGDFGVLTQNAVIAFQAIRGLQKDGIAGFQTWGELLK